MLNSRYAPVVALAILGIVVVLALGWFFAISPELNKAADASREAGDIRANTTLIQESSAQLDQYQKQLDADDTTGPAIELNAPSRIDTAAFRERYRTIAEDAQVSLVTVEQLEGALVDGWTAEPGTLVSNRVAKLFETGPVAGTGAATPAPTTTAPTDGTTTDPAATGGWTPVVTPENVAGPVAGDVRMVTIEITIVGNASQVSRFLTGLMDPTAPLFQVFDVTQEIGPTADLLDERDLEDTDIQVKISGALYVHNADLSIVDEDALGEARPNDDAFSVLGGE